MKMYEVTTRTPDSETSISGKCSTFDAYNIIAKDFDGVLKKATKKLRPKLKETIRDITYVCEVRS